MLRFIIQKTGPGPFLSFRRIFYKNTIVGVKELQGSMPTYKLRELTPSPSGGIFGITFYENTEENNEQQVCVTIPLGVTMIFNEERIQGVTTVRIPPGAYTLQIGNSPYLMLKVIESNV